MFDRTRIVLCLIFQSMKLVCSSTFAGGQYVLGFEPIWFGPAIIVRRLRVMSLFWPIGHQVNQRAQSLLDARSATAISQSINTIRSKRLTHTWVAHTFVHHFFISYYLQQVISSTILHMLIS
jgi:hypothetical protein